MKRYNRVHCSVVCFTGELLQVPKTANLYSLHGLKGLNSIYIRSVSGSRKSSPVTVTCHLHKPNLGDYIYTL